MSISEIEKLENHLNDKEESEADENKEKFQQLCVCGSQLAVVLCWRTGLCIGRCGGCH